MFAVVDIETTGSVLKEDRIIEIAIIIQDGTEIFETFQSLVNPLKGIPPFIQNLTGISDEMVADAPVFSEIAEQVFKLLNGKTLVAHGASFDYNFIRKELQFEEIEFNATVLDTHKLSRKYIPGLDSYKIKSLVTSLELEPGNLHRAFDDALVASQVFSKIFQLMLEDEQ